MTEERKTTEECVDANGSMQGSCAAQTRQGNGAVPAGEPRESGVSTDMTRAAIDEQKLDEFDEKGWTKVLAPAKVNLHLAIGARQENGYHQAVSIMHALALHDVVYLRAIPAQPGSGLTVDADMVGRGGIAIPQIDAQDNIAAKAAQLYAQIIGRTSDETVQIRIEKNIPFEAGLGGGSSDAAATLVGLASLWNRPADDPALEHAARQLGSDVAFFLRGGCGRYAGTGDEFEGKLVPRRGTILLVKPEAGVSTAAAYRAFDEDPHLVDAQAAERAAAAETAEEVALFNNLAPAAERVLPALAEIREWLLSCAGVQETLLCGSGSTTFAVVDTMQNALAAVTEARKRGWWARTSSFAPLGAVVVPQDR